MDVTAGVVPRALCSSLEDLDRSCASQADRLVGHVSEVGFKVLTTQRMTADTPIQPLTPDNWAYPGFPTEAGVCVSPCRAVEDWWRPTRGRARDAKGKILGADPGPGR